MGTENVAARGGIGVAARWREESGYKPGAISARTGGAAPGHLRLPRRPLWVGAISALVVAALLVAWLQRQHSAEEQVRATEVYEAICARTATLLADRLQQDFGAAVLETLEEIDHVALSDYRMETIAPLLAAGGRQHQYVDRFFLWSRNAPRPFHDQVLFYAPDSSGAIPLRDSAGTPLGSLFADDVWGHEIWKEALAPAHGGQTFVLFERVVDGSRYQVIVHQYGTVTPSRAIEGIMGYMVNLGTVRERILGEIVQRELARIEPAGSSASRLAFGVLDQHGQRIHGTTPTAGRASARAPLELSFFPPQIPKAWVSGALSAPRWQIQVSSIASGQPPNSQDYLFVAVIALIAIALLCAVSVNRQSARLAHMQADFVANVTHQLKTPLSLLLATSQTLCLERVRTPEKIREYAARLQAQSARLTRLVEQILRFSRIEAGEDRYDIRRIDLVALGRESTGRYIGPHGDCLATPQFVGPADQIYVDADASALEEVLTNLLDNAFNYGGAADGVHVAVVRHPREAVLSVSDRGPGVAAADLPHIFEKFYRGQHGGRSKSGFGLGLSIVREIVEAHRGRVVVNSVPGEGAEFQIILPLAASEAS